MNTRTTWTQERLLRIFQRYNRVYGRGELPSIGLCSAPAQIPRLLPVNVLHPDALVFQSVKNGQPMSDQNILKRHLQPAARKLAFYVNWRALRTSHATWLVQAGADPKAVQGQMRHSRISTTMDIYAQIVPTSQRQAMEKLTKGSGHSRHVAHSDDARNTRGGGRWL
jgi:integrase